MPIPLFGKLISGTGNPYADANEVEVDASGFDGNLATTDVNLQLVAQKIDDLILGGVQLTTEQVQDIVGAMFDQNSNVAYDDADGEVDITFPTQASGDSLLNSTGGTLPKLTPVVVHVDSSSILEMRRATPSNTGLNNGPGLNDNYIVGFLPESVNSGSSAVPARKGVFNNISLQASNNSPGQQLAIRLVSGNLVVHDANFNSASDYAPLAGFVISNEGVSGYTVYVDLDLVEQSRTDYFDGTGKEDDLGNPATDDFVLSSTALGVRSWIAQGAGGGDLSAVGTPTDGQYPQWASASTLRALDGIPSADIVLDEVLLQTDGLISVPNETAYDLYANRRVLFRHQNPSPSQEKIFQLPQTINRDGLFNFIRTGDFFEIVNDATVDPTRTMTVRAFSSAESIGGTTQFVTLQPNEFIRVEIPPFGLSRWPVVSRGFVSGASGVSGSVGSSMMTATVVTDRPYYENRPWTNNLNGAAVHIGDVTIEKYDMLADANIIDSTTSSAVQGESPVSVVFDNDQAMVAFWASIIEESTLDITNTVASIRGDLAAAVTWIDNNVIVGYDFEMFDPDVDFNIQAFTHIAGSEVSVEIESGQTDLTTLPQFIIGRRVFIQDATNPVFNGEFIISAVTTSHFTISHGSFSSTTVETDSPANAKLKWYGDVITAAPTVNRQFNFRLYYSSSRSGTDATILNHHWDSSLDINTVNSALDIPYIAAEETLSDLLVEGRITTTDREGNTHFTSSGTLHSVALLDNGDPRFNPLPASAEYSNERTIPEGSPVVHVRTEGIVTLRLPPFADIPVGQTRQYRVYSDPLNEDSEVTVTVGLGGSPYFDGRVRALYIGAGQFCDFEIYNDGFNNSARIVTPINKSQISNSIYTTAVTTTTANTTPLDTSTNRLAGGTNDDPQAYFWNPSNSNPISRLLTDGSEYEFEVGVDVLFNGAEPTGPQQVEVSIVPQYRNINFGGTSTFTDQLQHRQTRALQLSRFGQSGASAPKSRTTVSTQFPWRNREDDEFQFNLLIENIPAGLTLADFQIQNLQFRRKVIRGFV